MTLFSFAWLAVVPLLPVSTPAPAPAAATTTVTVVVTKLPSK